MYCTMIESEHKENQKNFLYKDYDNVHNLLFGENTWKQ
jgi:hypothetical protein